MLWIQCMPNPTDPSGICLVCIKLQVSRNIRLFCHRGRIKDVTLSWAASDPPPDVLLLAQTGGTFSRYITESSRDYVKTFMASKDNITKGIFSLACSHSKSGTVRPDPSCFECCLPSVVGSSPDVNTPLDSDSHQ